MGPRGMREERAQYGRRDWEGGGGTVQRRTQEEKKEVKGSARAIDCRWVHLPAERKGSRQNQMSSFGKRATAAPLTYLTQGPLRLSSAVPPQHSSKFIIE